MTVGESAWERRTRWFAPLILAAAAVVAYLNSFNVPLVFDGYNYLKDSSHIRDLTKLEEFFKGAHGRPFGYFTFALNYALDEYEVVSWHATNLAIHIAAACAAFGILRRTFASPRLSQRYGAAANRLALAVVLLWVVHPLNTQSVTYLYQRFESQMGLFYLLTLYCFIRYAERGRRGWAAASLVCCLLATTTKEVALTAPLMVVWYDRVFVASSWSELRRRRGIYHALLWGVLVVPAILIYRSAAAYPQAGILDLARITPQAYAVTQLIVVQHYLKLSLVPWPLNIDHALQPAAHWPLGQWWPTSVDWALVAGPAVVILGLLVLTIVAVRKWPALGYLGGWWFVILAPTSSIAPIIDLAFEHRTYLSLLAPLTAYVLLGREAIAWCGRRASWRPATVAACGTAATLIVAATLAVVTLRRNEDYRSHISLWRDVIRQVPNNPRAHYNLAIFLQLERDSSVDEVISEYHKTIELQPAAVDAYVNLGNLYLYNKHYDEAEHYQLYALQLVPEYAPALFGMAEICKARGDVAMQKAYLERLLKVEPSHEAGRIIQQELRAAEAAAATATPSAAASSSP